MINQAFSKILVLITFVILIVGGILGYQYLKTPKEEIVSPGEEKSEEMVARDEKRMEDLEEIAFDLYIYYFHINKGKFPQNLTQLLEINQKFPDMIGAIPQDPKTNQPYEYRAPLDGEDFELCAELEATKERKCLNSAIPPEEKEELLKEAEEATEDASIRERDAKRLSDLAVIQTALQLYSDDRQGRYPAVIDGYMANLFLQYTGGKEFRDPLTNKPYLYNMCPPSGEHYHLGAKLEDENSPYLTQDADLEGCGFSGEDPVYDVSF